MNLSGTLTDWTVGDLLNVMKVTGKTASLHVKGRRTGVIHFSSGRVVGAVLDGDSAPAGKLESRAMASDTLFVLAALGEGTFEVGPFEGPDGDGWDVDALLSDMHQLDGLESDLVKAGIREAPLILRDHITQPVTIQVEDWWALASLVSVLSFDQLEEVFGRGRAIRLLHALWRLDLLETVEEPAPTVEQEDEPMEEASPPMVTDEKPARVDLSMLNQPEPDDEPAPAHEAPPVNEATVDRNDESWLDEIAAAAEPNPPKELPSLSETRRVMGVSAPASTVLTGGVLDEMRRLRIRPSGD